MRGLSILTHRRPHYLKQTLEALSHCHTIRDWDVYVIMDNPDLETESIVKSYPWKYIYYDTRTSEPYFRISEATRFALTNTFLNNRTEFAVHLEEDCVPAQDFLEYMAWADQIYKDTKEVFTVCAWWGSDDLVRNHIKDFSHDTLLDRHFTPWGWGLWRDRWNELLPRWSDEFWDRRLNEEVRGERFSVFPKITRTKNIGAIGTQPYKEWLERERRANPVLAPETNPGEWL